MNILPVCNKKLPWFSSFASVTAWWPTTTSWLQAPQQQALSGNAYHLCELDTVSIKATGQLSTDFSGIKARTLNKQWIVFPRKFFMSVIHLNDQNMEGTKHRKSWKESQDHAVQWERQSCKREIERIVTCKRRSAPVTSSTSHPKPLKTHTHRPPSATASSLCDRTLWVSLSLSSSQSWFCSS